MGLGWKPAGAVSAGVIAGTRGRSYYRKSWHGCVVDHPRWKDPGGIKAISRGLSAATSPERSPTKSTHPGRYARGHGAFFRSAFYHPFRVSRFNSVDSGGVASAQPPANGCDPSGIAAELPICDHWRILADIGGEPPRAPAQSLSRSLTLPPASRERNGSRRD